MQLRVISLLIRQIRRFPRNFAYSLENIQSLLCTIVLLLVQGVFDKVPTVIAQLKAPSSRSYADLAPDHSAALIRGSYL